MTVLYQGKKDRQNAIAAVGEASGEAWYQGFELCLGEGVVVADLRAAERARSSCAVHCWSSGRTG